METVDLQTNYQLTQTQLGIYAECIKRSGEIVYNAPRLHKIDNAIDFSKLAKAIEAVVAAHEYIKMRLITNADGQPRQQKETGWYGQAIEEMTDAEFSSAKMQLIKPFDLTKPSPLFCLRLIETELAKYFFTDFHHIIFDGVSYECFMDDLAVAYQGGELAAEEWSSFDIAQEELRRRETADYKTAKDWYLTHFKDLNINSLPLPDKNGKEAVISNLRLELTAIDSRAIERFCKSNNIKKSALFSGVYGLVLAAYTNTTSALFATVFHGRNDPREAKSIGMLVKTHPVYTDTAKAGKIIEYFANLQAQMADCRKNSLYSYAEIMAECQINELPIFAYQGNLDFSGDAICGFKSSLVELPYTATGSILAVEIYKDLVNDTYKLHVEWQENLYSQKFIKAFISSYEHILLQMINKALDDSSKNIMQQIELVNGQVKTTLLRLGYGGRQEYNVEETFVDAFNKRAALTPNKMAVAAENGSLTYTELAKASDLLAAKLLALDVEENEFVCVMLPRVKEFIVSTIGVFKAGGAYVPLDSEYPNERLLYMLADSQSKVLITTKALFKEKQTAGDFNAPNIIFVDEIDFTAESEAINKANPDLLAYMIYTSGSTGKPKGVMVKHKSLCSYLSSWRGEAYEILPTDRISCYSSFSFDASVYDLYGALFSGASLYIVPTALRQDLLGLIGYLNENNITGGIYTTQLGMELLNQSDLGVRFVILGGEKLKPVRQCKTSIINAYGPTEFTVCSCTHLVDQAVDTDNIPIGKPLANTWSYVLNGNQQLVPPGMAGELYLSGRQIAAGYWNRPDLTAEKFIDNPYATSEENDKMYRTGDLVRWNEAGELEYLGRIDSQVKLRGFRIELGEIESKIAAYHNVTGSVVEVKEINGIQHLCAYYTAAIKIVVNDLREDLAKSLTDYMVPDIYMQLDKLPLTPNGKVDRRALPMPSITIDAAEIIAPGTRQEEEIFAVARELLKIDEFGVTNNLFGLGLTSMMAIKLSILLQKRLGLKLGTKDILTSPTIRQMSQLAVSGTEEVKVYEKREYYPLTANQQGLYVEWEKNRTALQYNVPICLKIAKLDEKKLRAALQAVVAAHPYLKTKLTVTAAGEVVQWRLDDASVEITSEKLTEEPTPEFFNSRVKAFDLLKDTLYRFEIYETADNTYLFSDIHHIIYDGTSVSILLNDLSKAYEGEPLTAEHFTAFDQALAAESAIQNPAEARQYFAKLLQDRKMTKFPQSLQVDQREKQTQNIQKTIDDEAIKKMCWSAGITESSFFLATFCIALHTFAAERNVMISTIGSGRENRDLANTIGMFVKTVPIVADLTEQSFLDYAKALQQQLWNTMGQTAISFSELVAEYKINPQINYAYQGGIADEFVLAGRKAENIPVELAAPKFPCGLIISPAAGKYDILFGYDAKLYSKADAAKFVDVLLECVNYFVKDTAVSIEQFTPNIEREYYPLLDNQLGLVLEYELAPQSLQYNLPWDCPLPKQFSPQKIKDALVNTLQIHHNVLTQITKIGEGYGQIANNEIPEIVIIEAAEQEVAALREKFIQPFKLYDSCLARFMIIATEKYNYLLFDIYHILFDGMSSTIFLQDLLNNLTGKVVAAEKLPAYEYALIEKSRKGSNEYKAAKDYFTGKLTGISMSQLPSSSNVIEGRLGRIISNVDDDAVNALCTQSQISPNQFFMGVFSVALAKYTREDTVLFCTVHNGRMQEEIQNAAGFFIKTLPFCLTIDDSMSWLDYLRLARQEIRTLWQQQAVSFKELAEEFNIKENITFLFQRGVEKAETLSSGESVYLSKVAVPNTFKPLSVEILHRDSGKYEIRIEYNASMYTAEYIQGFTNAYVTLLNEAAINITRPIKQASLLTHSEKMRLLQISAGKTIEYNQRETFVHQFIRQVSMTPERVAVVAGNGTLSYRELADKSDILAAKLLELGIKQNEFVCIMLPRLKEYMVSTLAVFKAGGAYVPLDSEYPAERLLYMLADSQAKVLITSRELYKEKQQSGDFSANKIIFIDEFDFTAASAQPINNSKANHLAYMIYTSGSTGKPKGVMIQHKAMTSFVNTIIDMYALTDRDNITCHSSFSFDASIEDLYPILAVGGQLHILAEPLRHDLTALHKYLVSNSITGGCYTTQLGVELLDQFDLPVRYLTVGGEKLNKTVDSTVKVYNTYGPTEFTVDATYFVVDNKKVYSNIPIGYPLSNSCAYVVDKNNQLVPQGVVGELCLAGRQIAKGYWQRPDLTAEKFVDNPYATAEENAKMYRTGDLVRWNEAGEIEYLGRIDNQVKLRGFRIELGEIESKIAAFADITGAIVEVKEIGGVQHLCAYFTASNIMDTAQLQSYLAKSLADYMVPTAYMQLEKLPFTPNGKINRKALPMPTISKTTKYVAPTNEAEAKICGVFAEILDDAEIGINDDFFKIGGTSMLAIKAIIKINNLDYQIQYGDLFKWKTPAVIAKHLQADTEAAESDFFAMSHYDYSAINKVLAHNGDGLADATSTEPSGAVLLTGATGYLGIHVLNELLKKGAAKIYCLLRPSKTLDIESRLKMLLMYYFNNPCEELIGKRIILLAGDITDAASLAQLKALPIKTVINCAAIVKHYEAGDMMDRVNYHGVVNLIEICQATAMKLVHISTYSTAGMAAKDADLLADKYSENTLYLGQSTSNKYIWTKYQAERAILEAVSQGLKAKIMRVGNLMARSDGEFQINSGNNAFINMLKSYKVLGAIPLKNINRPVELSQIDKVAESIVLLMATPDNMVVFHPYNNFNINMAILLNGMAKNHYQINTVSEEEFNELFAAMMHDRDKSQYLSGMLHYGNVADIRPVEVSNEFTTVLLYKLGFTWPLAEQSYVERFINNLAGLGFFDE